jgi:hypothetical protein
MFNVQSSVLAVTLTAGLLGPVGLTGCSGGGAAGNGLSGGTAAGMAVSKENGAFSAAQLENALLTRVNGARPVSKPASGSYAALPEVHAAARMTGSTVSPKACAMAAVLPGAALDASVLGSAPAAVVSFRVGSNGVSEVLASPTDAATAAALGKPIPASCDRYSASVSGKTFHYAVHQNWIQGIGRQPARVLEVATLGQRPPTSVWSLLYRGHGFVGAITVTGPNASEAAVRELGQQAYAYAAKTLSLSTVPHLRDDRPMAAVPSRA